MKLFYYGMVCFCFMALDENVTQMELKFKIILRKRGFSHRHMLIKKSKCDG